MSSSSYLLVVVFISAIEIELGQAPMALDTMRMRKQA